MFVFTLVAICCGGGFLSSNFALAENDGITVSVCKRNNPNEILQPSSTENQESGLTINNYEWENASKITISLTNEDITNDNVSLGIELLKGYASENLDYASTDKLYIEDVDGVTVSGTTCSYTFNIDTGVSKANGSGQTTLSGWGIYRFSIEIGEGGNTFTSDLYNIMPSDELVTPTFSIHKQGSTSSMHDDYICTITNQSNFKYADTTRLTWYAEGVSVDGTSYCLTAEDFQIEGANFDSYLYTSIERTGFSFIFNAHKGETYINGNWTIYCIYKIDEGHFATSEKITIKSGLNFNTLVFVICVVAVVIVSIGIVLLTAYLKTKKEKVW